MNTLVNVKRWCILISVMALFPFVGYTHVSQTESTVEEEKKEIKLNTATWIEKFVRSLFSPFTAIIESGMLTIQSEDVSCDLTICITDCRSGNVVYSMEVSQGSGSLITIPTDGWGSGQYYWPSLIRKWGMCSGILTCKERFGYDRSKNLV